MKIATWNINSLRVRQAHILSWLKTEQPDILAIQEIKMQSQLCPIDAFNAVGYEIIANGQKTYNGVAIISRLPIDNQNIDMGLPNYPDDIQRRVLAVNINNIRIINIYVPNGQAVGSEKYQYKLQWLKYLRDYIADQLKQYPRLIVLGDFNIAPADEDVHDPIAWQGHVLVSEPEREAFRDLLALGLYDSFRLFPQEPRSYSWWDYRMMAFRLKKGLRIDHILVSEALKAESLACHIDKVPRGWDQPSDHTPVVLTTC